MPLREADELINPDTVMKNPGAFETATKPKSGVAFLGDSPCA